MPMANRRMATMDIVELVRLLRTGASDRRITHLLGHNRRTIAKYREWAVAHGLLEGPLPPAGEMHGLLARTMPDTPPPQQVSTLAPYHEEIAALRAQGVEMAFDQRAETWLLCHRHAFETWGGTPGRIVPDNLKAAIVRASFTEPLAQRAYRECAAHYGFLIDPTPPRTPRHKGKVEQGGVH